MTDNSEARWAPDPSGRHELRFWDGTAWTDQVMNDYVPAQDPLTAPAAPVAGTPRPARSAPRPLLPWWGHLMVGLASCGLWFIVAPAVYWFRKGAVRPALIWSGAWALLIAFTAFSGGSDDPVATVAATSSATTNTTAPAATTTAPPPSPRALVAAAPPSTQPTSSAARAPATTRRTSTTHRTTTRAKRTTTSRTTSTSRTSRAGRTTTKPAESGTDPRFDTCKAAKSHGYGPYRAGQVEYSWYDDADGDGIVCE